jgi:hypothetical protein
MREACSLVWSVLVLLFRSRASLEAEILHPTTPLLPGAVLLGDFIQMQRHAMPSQGSRLE